jgi:hypothetical protein
MTAKRKAELQRKLALAAVPKPPSDLADRIKGEIPKHLAMDAEKERVRLRQAVAFNVRVAASIILLVSSVYLALHLLSRKFGPEEPAAMARVPAASAETASAAPVVLPTAPPSAESVAAKAKKESDRKQIVVAQARPEPVATPGQAKDNETQGRRADEHADRREAAGFTAAAESAPAAQTAAAQTASAADDEMVQRFSRAAPAAKMAALALDVEAAAAPFDASKQILRVSLDGARNATPDVAFNDDTVASWHTVTSDGTSLYEITLRPQTGANDVIATARLNNMERVIRRTDLRSWNDASRRMKYATLAAALEAGVPPKDVAAKARAAGLDDLAATAEERARH